MRKSALFLALPLLAAITLNSCKKEVSPEQNSNQETITKVNNWLDDNKVNKPEGRVANIELLQNNLEFSQLRIEESSRNEQIIVIPINERLKTEKGIDPNAIPNLVLIVDAAGKISNGNIVFYFPEDTRVKRVPDNTFHAIINTAHPSADGKYRFHDLTGKTLYELLYENDRLKSVGRIKSPTDSGAVRNSVSNANLCVDWFWVYTLYDEFGNVMSTYSEYIGTTCASEYCSDPYAIMLCGYEQASGGEGNVGEIFEEEKNYWGKLHWTLQTFPQDVGGGKLEEYVTVRIIKYRRNEDKDCIHSYAGSIMEVENNSYGSGNVGIVSTSHAYNLYPPYKEITLIRIGRANFPNDFYVEFSKTRTFHIYDFGTTGW